MRSVLFISSSISFGGAAKMLCFVAESLAERGHNVAIVNLKSTQNVTDYERSLNDKVKLFTVPPLPKGKEKNLWRLRFIKGVAKEIKAEIIVGFTMFPNLYATLLGKALRIPSIISERADPTQTIGGSLKSRLAKWIVERSTGGVFQTEGAQAYYGRGLRRRGVVIPNPIFLDGDVPNVPFEEREKSVVSVGRLDNEQKRYDVMLKAFQLFRRSHPDYVLKLYGHGVDEDKIKEWSVELKLSDSVRFMGLTSQPMEEIAKDGIFLITSDYEGISNALLEAMAVGLPCVSTDHTPGGARLLIQNRENGLLAPVGDAEKLAAALSEFADNPELAEKCGENARDVVNRFEPNGIVDMWEEYIEKLYNKTA